MSVFLQPLHILDQAALTAYWALYEAAFPPAERKSPEEMRSGIHASAYDIWVIATPEQPVAGLAITVRHENLVMLDYLAVDPSLRGQGIGHAALPLLRTKSGEGHFFLEIEVPTENCDNPIQRKRRKAFYLSAGLVETQVRAHIYDTNMELLAYPEDAPFVTFEGYAKLVEALFPPNMRVAQMDA